VIASVRGSDDASPRTMLPFFRGRTGDGFGFASPARCSRGGGGPLYGPGMGAACRGYGNRQAALQEPL